MESWSGGELECWSVFHDHGLRDHEKNSALDHEKSFPSRGVSYVSGRNVAICKMAAMPERGLEKIRHPLPYRLDCRPIS